MLECEHVAGGIAILGGTGAEGSGLAMRFARAGARVAIGSRDPAKAQRVAARIGHTVEGHANADALDGAEIALLTVPLAAQIATLESVRARLLPGMILVDATVPLEVAIGGRLSHPLTLFAGSAAQQAARHVPDGVPVVAAFHSLSAELLARPDVPVDSDVLMCGDSIEAKARVRKLIALLPGARAVDAGPLEAARLVENVAALLVALNLRYKVKHSGVRITGLE
jgi:NADPH-dependent F420 reductase